MSNNFAENSGTILQKSSKSERVFFLDVLRAIACLCVVMVHTSAGFLTNDFGSLNFWVGNVFDSLARIGVPLFVMISGTVFLDENYNYTNIKLFRHIKKIVVFFVFWSLFYSLVYTVVIPLIKHNGISLKSTIGAAILGHRHLWFCFMIVGLYLIIPLLRLWVNKENVKWVRYFIVLSFIFSMFLPSIIEYLSVLFPEFGSLNAVIDNINIKYAGGYTVYFILGWYLNNYGIKHEKLIVILGIIGIAISITGTALLSILRNEAYQTYGNLSVHVAFQTIMVYVLVKNRIVSGKKPDRIIQNAVGLIADNSLGIYAIHVIVLFCAGKLLTKIGITNAFIYIPAAYIISLLLSLFISFVFRKIPLIKNVV